MIYLLCLSELAGVTALFFAVARGGFRAFGLTQRVLVALVALPLIVSGIAHLVVTGSMARMVPPVFPVLTLLVRTLLVVVTGLLELAGAVGLFMQRTRRIASVCIALLMIAVFPANIYVAGQTVLGMRMPGVALRLLMQMIYIVLVLAAGWGLPILRSQ